MKRSTAFQCTASAADVMSAEKQIRITRASIEQREELSCVQNSEAELLDEIAKFTHDPLGFVNFAFPWQEEGELEHDKGPRAWQEEAFIQIRDHLSNEKTRHQPCLVARASGHGIGKSAYIAMIINWAMSTCEDCKVVVTANTETQLRTKTWPEVLKWARLSITRDWFKPNATSLHSVDKGHEKSWTADAVTWSVNNTEAFAGLHNKRKRIVVIFDEASAIHDKVWEVTEGALTDEETEIIWIAFGNFTRATGRFADCFGRFRHRWKTAQIDSRTVEGTNKEQIKKWQDDYGEDSDFFKVRVRGMPPSSSQRQFISTTDVDAAFGRHLREDQYNFAPKIISVDPAWEGDDECVIALRQGLNFRILATFAKNDNDVHMANIIANFEDQEKADAVFIDGGYGTGIVSVGRTLNRHWQLVWFAGESSDKGCLNKRAEMWKLTRDWLKAGGSIPKDTMLHAELIGPETVPRIDGKIQLESKQDMKERGLPSPNRADALCITFAFPVAPKIRIGSTDHSKAQADWDPFA